MTSQSIQIWISPSPITPPLVATPVLFQYLIGVASSLRLRSAMMRSKRARTSSGGVVCAQAMARDTPSISLRDVFGLSLMNLSRKHIGAAGEVAEQVGIGEQPADAAALQRLVAQHAVERA